MTIATRGLAAAILMAGCTLATSAEAQSLGDRVTCSATAYFCSAATATVGSGLEFTYGPSTTVPFLNLDFSPGLLNITSRFGSLQFGAGQTVSFRDTTSAFTSATLLTNTSSTLATSDVTFNNGLVTINFAGRTITAGGQLTVGLTTLAGAVPEPASWAMMILGMGATGFALRRQGRTRIRLA